MDRSFLGHPRGLATLFMTEMWERFSFYGMRAILVFYLASPVTRDGLGMDETTANALLGVYMAFVYLTALPGGWIADRLLGARRTVLCGGVVIMAGHISMAVPVTGPAFAYLGLILIVIGTGLLKPNISTMVGFLYRDDDDARRDAGFSLFYLGINIGAFISPFITGWLGDSVGWHAGFAAAAVGMALGLVQYVLGTRHLQGAGEEPRHRLTADERSHFAKIAAAGTTAVVLAAGLAVGTGAFTVDRLTIAFTLIAVACPAAYFGYILLGSHDLSPEESSRVKAYIWLFIAAAIFWMIYDLAAGPLNLFAEKRVELSLFGFAFPASWTQSINPLFIMICIPLFAVLWLKMGDRIGAPLKFAIGLFMVGLSFVVMAAAAQQASDGVRISLMWLVAVYLIQVLGELSLSPVGLSVTTKLAPDAFKSQMMGVWFLATAVGDAIGGQSYRLTAFLPEPMYYLVLGVIALVAAFALTMFVRRLRELMGEMPAVASSNG